MQQAFLQRKGHRCIWKKEMSNPEEVVEHVHEGERGAIGGGGGDSATESAMEEQMRCITNMWERSALNQEKQFEELRRYQEKQLMTQFEGFREEVKCMLKGVLVGQGAIVTQLQPAVAQPVNTGSHSLPSSPQPFHAYQEGRESGHGISHSMTTMELQDMELTAPLVPRPDGPDVRPRQYASPGSLPPGMEDVGSVADGRNRSHHPNPFITSTPAERGGKNARIRNAFPEGSHHYLSTPSRGDAAPPSGGIGGPPPNMTGNSPAVGSRTERSSSFRRDAGHESEVKLLATYEGKGDWDSFIGPFERMALKRSWSKDICLDMLYLRLRGSAMSFVMAQPAPIREDYDKLAEQLRRRFGREIPEGTARRKLSEVRQGKETSLAEFGEEVRKLVTLAYPHVDVGLQEEFAAEAFL